MNRTYFPVLMKIFVSNLLTHAKKAMKILKTAISELAPCMASALKEATEWENPSLALSPPPPDLKLVTALNQKVTPWTEEDLQEVMETVLGPASEVNQLSSRDELNLTNADIEQAYANYVTDGLITLEGTGNPTTNSMNTLLKGIQPYREKPSKDRSKRFATSDLPFNNEIPESHDFKLFQYWTAKVFLLSQIIYLSECSKPVQSSIKVSIFSFQCTCSWSASQCLFIRSWFLGAQRWNLCGIF